MVFHHIRRMTSKLFTSGRSAHSQNRRTRAGYLAAVAQHFQSLEGRTLFSFTAPVGAMPIAQAPVATMAGDFNHDGRMDLLLSNTGPNRVTVLLGNGDGTFGTPIDSPLGVYTPGSNYTGSQAGTMAVADLNNDGNLDVTVISGTLELSLLGRGDGTFAAPTSQALGSSPARISLGDVNGDGKTDLVGANTTGTVSVLLGNGDGTFAAKVEYAAGPDTQDVKIGDFNHDGKADLIAANAVSLGTITELQGNGDGTFKPARSYYAFSAPYQINVADYNDDGNLDVAVANSYTSSCVTIVLGNPDGSFQQYHSYDTGFQPWDLESADVDGDGAEDLIDANGGSFQIEMNHGDGTFGLPITVSGAGWTFAAADFDGDGMTDLGGVSGGSAGVMLNTSAPTTNISAAVGFIVSTAPATVAGAPLAITLTAVDAQGNPVPDFAGLIRLHSSDSRFGTLAYTLTSNDAGTHTFTLGTALYTAGLQTINALGPVGLTGSAAVSVSAASASRFGITADTSLTAGGAVSFTVTAQDAWGNLASDFLGTLHFTSSDARASLPADVTLSAADAGTVTLFATLRTSGTQTITATSGTFAGTSNAIGVAPSTAVRFGLVGGGGHIGSPKIVTVQAYDVFGNVATGYSGTLHFAASDAAMQLSADSAITNGVGTYVVTPMSLGAQVLAVSDIETGSLTGLETIQGTPGDAARYVMTPVAGGVAGSVQTFTVTVYDNFGNVAVDYAGSIRFASSDFSASLPFYTFTADDAGTHTFTAVFRTAGSHYLSAFDVFNPAITTSQTGIVITPGAAIGLTTTALVPVVAGTTQDVTVTARDAFGNVATAYTGTISFASSDTRATLPPAYAFTAADAGRHIFTVTYKTDGSQDLTVTDAANTTMRFYQNDINILAGAVTGFSIKSPTNATAGTAFTVTITAVDAYGNDVTNYTGKIHFSGPSGGGNLLPADYTFSPADAGAHTFSITLTSTGTQTITLQDVLTSSIKSSFAVNVKTASTSGGGGTSSGGGGGGGGGGSGGGGKKTV